MLRLETQLLEQITLHAVETYPQECCGVMLGLREDNRRVATQVIRCRNAAAVPATRYEIDPEELIDIQRQARNAHLQVVGFYHSHPDHPPTASTTDISEASWTGCSYLIVSVEGQRVTAIRSYGLVDHREGRALLEEPLVNAATTTA